MKATLTTNADSDARVLEEWTDEDLLIQYRLTDDRRLFEALVGRYERELYSYLRRYLGDAEMADDTFQAAFLQVHLKRDHYEQGRKFRPWLYTIATNQAIDAQRRNRRHRMVSLDRAGSDHVEEVGRLADVLVSDAPDPHDVAEDEERNAWVRSALADLSGQARQVIELVYYRGMKYREAAEILDVPVGTIKSRLHAAINKLNDSLAKQEAERRG
jgi:RNA polymerase sigma-70 factor (ECF subfamily)